LIHFYKSFPEAAKMTVEELVTDYLIIGAGAMGMGFLEEIIVNSSNIQAIIVDTRNKPGGHWNDAYSFVRLHQPAITYGNNSRNLGVGGHDLATKSQILSHFEMCLADLIETGRVKFLSQCKYVGDGKVVSLLNKNLSYKITYRKKLVDATCCETRVPATSEPNFKVHPSINFMPINGLSGLKEGAERYMIVGGGKTGIDAALYLLDHGVDPDTISWVIPNDAWFLNRDNFDFLSPDIMKQFKNYIASMIDDDDETWKEVYTRLEKNRVNLRLDPTVEPTRNRYATVGKEEIPNLRRIKNVIRKGRISEITADKIIFTSGQEMDLETGTVVVDCARNSTRFTVQQEKVFDGDKINIQFIMLPPPGMSTTIIAAMELKYPDGEEKKKNDVCKPIPIPCYPEDAFLAFRISNQTQKAASKEIGFGKLMVKANQISHLTFFNKLKFFLMFFKVTAKFNSRLDKYTEQIEVERKEKGGPGLTRES